MNLDKASQWIIAACLIGLALMVGHKQTDDDIFIYLLLIPVAIMFYAKKVNKEELQELQELEDEQDRD